MIHYKQLEKEFKMIKISNKQVIEDADWNNLIQETYGRHYVFQQQDGCKSRGIFEIQIPSQGYDFPNDTVSEDASKEEMGVSFKAWLSRDPEKELSSEAKYTNNTLYWERNFYPDIHTVANDLHAKGLIPAGDYVINIDW